MNNSYLWGDKRFYSLDYYLKQEYGQKLYKLSLNGGMTCPNRDGTLGDRGCIFCSSGGSGDFSSSSLLSITKQIEKAKELVRNKMPKQGVQNDHNNHEIPRYIAYFQAYTNTYGDINYLRKIYTEAINNPDIAVLSIATRPDCLGDDVLALLMELNKIKPVWIELGLQTCKEATATFIRRGYPLSVFKEAVTHLNHIGVSIIVHLILGLPGESLTDNLETISYISKLPIQGIKLQLLHVLKGTDLAQYSFPILTLEEYVDTVITCLEHIPPSIVVHRITGDGPKKLLIAPLWSSNKKMVLNRINQRLKEKDTWQGKFY